MAPGRWLAALGLLGAASGQMFDSGPASSEAPEEVEENIKHVQVYPRLTPQDKIGAIAKQAEQAASWAKASEFIAKARSRAAMASKSAYQQELKALTSQMTTADASGIMESQAAKVQALRRQALEVARHTDEIVGLIPDAIDRGARRAVSDVIAEAQEKLQAEVVSVAEAARAAEAAKAPPPPPAGREAAVPFDAAKKEALATMQSYEDTAQKLAKHSIDMKNRAMELGLQAANWQMYGDGLTAQTLQMAATDLMDKSGPMREEAIAYDKAAWALNKEAGAFGKLADASVTDASKAPPVLPLGLPTPKPPLKLPDPTQL
eukprot:TRINITY_DN110508_c0_g1_i1.p1 TRINITY_DN110508_c0_g1~~TRINITY_DN110508_c0_g1_i1.p1  ORF type:complete len:319 (-),score=111.91 TRINITY_DN110508_c0_g1_i1:90-1046(-)